MEGRRGRMLAYPYQCSLGIGKVSPGLVENEVVTQCLDAFVDGFDTGVEQVPDGLNVRALCHGHDSKLIFFSNPDNEDSLLLVLVNEDTTSCWPVVVTANELEGWVVVDVQVVKINILHSVFFWHTNHRMIFSLQVFILEAVEHFLHHFFEFQSLFLRHVDGERKRFDVSRSTDPRGGNGAFWKGWEGDLLVGFFSSNVGVDVNLMVFQDDFVEHRSH